MAIRIIKSSKLNKVNDKSYYKIRFKSKYQPNFIYFDRNAGRSKNNLYARNHIHPNLDSEIKNIDQLKKKVLNWKYL